MTFLDHARAVFAATRAWRGEAFRFEPRIGGVDVNAADLADPGRATLEPVFASFHARPADAFPRSAYDPRAAQRPGVVAMAERILWPDAPPGVRKGDRLTRLSSGRTYRIVAARRTAAGRLDVAVEEIA